MDSREAKSSWTAQQTAGFWLIRNVWHGALSPPLSYLRLRTLRTVLSWNASQARPASASSFTTLLNATSHDFMGKLNGRHPRYGDQLLLPLDYQQDNDQGTGL